MAGKHTRPYTAWELARAVGEAAVLGAIGYGGLVLFLSLGGG